MRARAPELLRKIPEPSMFQSEKLTSYKKNQAVLFLTIQNLGQVDADLSLGAELTPAQGSSEK
jgi:hypothetical protein